MTEFHKIWKWNQIVRLFGDDLATEIENLFLRSYPDLMVGKHDVVLDHQSVRELRNALFGEYLYIQKTPNRKLKCGPAAVHNWLVHSLERGGDQLGWCVENLPPTAKYKSPQSMLKGFDSTALVRLRRIDGLFLNSIREPAQADIPIQNCDLEQMCATSSKVDEKGRKRNILLHQRLLLGQVLYSSMRFSGLVRKEDLRGLVRCMREKPKVVGRRLLFELDLSEKQAPLETVSADSLEVPESKQIRLWIPDPLTSVLILQLRSTTTFEEIEDFESEWAAKASEIIEEFLGTLGLKLRFGSLQKWCLQAASLTVSPTVQAYRAGFLRTKSLELERSAALLGLEQPGNIREFVNSPDEPYGPDVGDIEASLRELEQTGADARKSYFALRKCFEGLQGPHWKKTAIENVDSFCNNEAPSMVHLLVARWTQALIRNSLQEHSKLSTVGGVLNCISALGPTFFVASSSLSVESFDEEDVWLGVYESVFEKKKASQKSRTVKEMQSVHDFMMSVLDEEIPDLDLYQHFGVSSKRRPLRAAYLTVPEMRAVQKSLQSMTNRSWAIKLEVMLLISYWCGTRIGELAGLQCCDIDWIVRECGAGKQKEILAATIVVRRNSLGRVKSTTSQRVINIAALMPECDLRVVYDFCVSRARTLALSLDRLSTSEEPLFVDGASPVSAKAVRSLLLPMLKQVTGNAGFRFHDLRHAAACNLFLALYLGTEKRRDIVGEVQGCEVLEEIGVKHLNHNIATLVDRRLIHIVSQTLGHAGFEETMASYLHVMELMSVEAAARDSMLYVGTLDGDQFQLNCDQRFMADYLGLSVGRASHLMTGLRSKTNYERVCQLLAEMIKRSSDDELVRYVEYIPIRPDAPTIVSMMPTPEEVHRIAVLSHRGGSDMEIAAQVEFPEELCTAFVEAMKNTAARLTQKEAKENRAPKRRARNGGEASIQFKGTRTQLLTGVGDVRYEQVGRFGEVPRLLASYPRPAEERELLGTAWQRITLLLQNLGLWQFDENGAAVFGGQCECSSEQLELQEQLRREFQSYLACVNSTKRSFHPFGSPRHNSEEDALLLLNLFGRFVPAKNIRIKWTPNQYAFSQMENEFRRSRKIQNEVAVIRNAPSEFKSKKWPWGIWAIELINDEGGGSYGLWYAVYLFCIFFEAVNAPMTGK